MEWLQYQSLTIHGNSYTKANLQLLIKEKTANDNVPPYEKSLYQFIAEWLSDKSFIESKTSGSTGTPKIIKLEKNKMIASAKATINFFQLNKNTQALLCLSCEHIAGKMMVVRAFVSGMNLIIAPPSSIPLENLSNQKIDFAAFVPMQVFSMIQHAQYLSSFQKIQNVIIGGSEISEKVKTQLKTFSNHVYETFGMTETISHIALKLISKKNSSEYFSTLDGITVSQNKNGCLIIHAPKLSERPIETFDIVDVIDSRTFRWLGRYDNVVISGSMKFYPEMIERKIKPFFNDSFFISGIPDEKFGNRLVMIIETKHTINEDIIKKQLKHILSAYEMPKEIFVLHEFVYTANGKLNRKATLHQLFK